MKKDRVQRISVVSMLKRREVLGFLGGTAAVSLMGCLRGQSTSAKPTGTSTQTPTRTALATTPTCVVRPQQTEGPYFVEEKLNRSDIRSDPYAAKGQRSQRNDQDRIFRDGGEQLMLQLSQDAQGYVGTFDIGLQIT